MREGKLKFVKTSESAPAKVIEYDTTIWAEAILQFDTWKEFFTTTAEYKKHIFEDMYFISSVWEKNNIRYSGIHKLNAESKIIPGTGLNLDNYEWTHIIKKKDQINEALYGVQELKGEKRLPPENEIQTWSYDWYVDNKVEKSPFKIKYFTEKSARQEAEKTKPNVTDKSTKVELKVTSEFSRKPSETHQMEIILLELIRQLMLKMREENCDGCQMNPPAPGQHAHMYGGCLDEGIDMVDEYILDALQVISSTDLVSVYNAVCRFLVISPQGSMQLARAVLDYVPVSKMETTLNGRIKLLQKDDVLLRAIDLLHYKHDPMWALVCEIIQDLNVLQRLTA